MSDTSDSGVKRPTQASAVIDALHALLKAPRSDDFYAQYAQLMQSLCAAQAALVLSLSEPLPLALGSGGSNADVQELEAWVTPERLQAVQTKAYSHETHRLADGLGVIVLMLQLIDAGPTVLLLALPERDRAHLKEALVRAMLVRDVRPPPPASTAVQHLPAVGSLHPALGPGLLDMLALSTQVMQAPRFGAAALALVNGLIRLLGLRQAVLCWRVGARAEVVAISHLERFEKTSRLVQAMQEAAGEVLSVDRVLTVTQESARDALQVLPPAHLELLHVLDGAQGLTGVPMRDASGQTQAVVLCATERGPIEPETLNQLLLMLEMVLPRLIDSRNRQLNPFKRFRLYALDKLSILFGPKRPWVKFWAVACSITVAVLLFGQMPYRIEASAQLTTDSVRVITPQMDGRLQEVLVDVGDLVKQGQTLSSLDTSDLRQQELEIGSELKRFQAEADKARAARALADLQVAMFRGAQASARLQRVRYLLEQSQLRAPFDGVVVEGERRKLMGASVRRGDAVFRVAQVQDLYLVLQVPERDVRSIGIDSQGEFVLLSQPGEPIAFKVSNFVPMAQVKGEEGNQFLLKAVVQGQAQPWWRPGMTGLAKIDVGYRNIGWILLHRTYDTLRLWFWL